MSARLKLSRLSGEQVLKIRTRWELTREEFAERFHATAQQVKNWETEKAGVRVPAPTSLLIRITFDPLARAQWLKSLKQWE